MEFALIRQTDVRAATRGRWMRAGLVIALLLIGPPLSRAEQSGDLAAIHTAVFDYFDGINEANRERLERAFHPGASLKSPGADGVLTIESISDAIDRWAGYEPQSRDGVVRSVEIDRGRLARVVFDFDGSYIDYLTLVKLAGRWVIIDKAFVATP